MKIAYLVNQYPLVSHSFIRRELQALESLDLDIQRISIRSTRSRIIDDVDIEEYRKTEVILNIKIVLLIYYMMLTFLFHPVLFFQSTMKAIQLGTKSKAGYLKHVAYLIEACALKVITQRSGIRHVHAHFGTNSTTVALLCHLLGGPPYSFTVHGPEEFDDPVGFSIEEKIKHAKFIIGVCSFGKSQLMRYCAQEFWHKIKVVRCSVDNSFFDEFPTPVPDNKRMVCVGRLCGQKGQLLLLEALKELKKRSITFEMIFAGDGEMRAVLEKKIKEFKLDHHVKITGWLNEDEVKNCIRESRAMVLSSFAEGLPVVIMEAFALARPVISTYIAGIPELVEHNKNGFLVPAGSKKALTNAMAKVLACDTSVLSEMGLRGRDRVKEFHDSITEAQKIKDLIFNHI